jgi:hypothetical protein
MDEPGFWDRQRRQKRADRHERATELHDRAVELNVVSRTRRGMVLMCGIVVGYAVARYLAGFVNWDSLTKYPWIAAPVELAFCALAGFTCAAVYTLVIERKHLWRRSRRTSPR